MLLSEGPHGPESEAEVALVRSTLAAATPPSNRISLFNLHTHSCPTLQRACVALSQITIILTQLTEKSTHVSRGMAGLHSLRCLMAS